MKTKNGCSQEHMDLAHAGVVEEVQISIRRRSE